MCNNLYSALLDTPEWEAKRNLIIEKDQHTCKRCGYNTKEPVLKSLAFILSSSTKIEYVINLDGKYNSMIVKIWNENDENDDVIFARTCIEDNNFSNMSDLLLVVNFASKIIYPFCGSILINQQSDFLYKENNKKKDTFFDNEFKIKFPKISLNSDIDIDLEGFFLIKKSMYYGFIKSKSLHVHHKCYRKGVKIWDQADNEYLTLCNVCHKIVHSNERIPFFNERNELDHFLTPCSRCGGIGYLPEYKKVEGGICFQCRGNKFQ
jgi:hypothetical protein